MRRDRKWLGIALSLLLLVSTGCGGQAGGMGEYAYTKTSDELVYFETSDSDLSFFLNDYFKRHAGGIYENGLNQKVTSSQPGLTAQQFFW